MIPIRLSRFHDLGFWSIWGVSIGHEPRDKPLSGLKARFSAWNRPEIRPGGFCGRSGASCLSSFQLEKASGRDLACLSRPCDVLGPDIFRHLGDTLPAG